MNKVLVPFAKKLPPDMKPLARAIPALPEASTPEDVIKIEKALESLEVFMANAGMFKKDELRIVNETRMTARWKLGTLLARVERKAGPGRGKKVLTSLTSFRALLKKLELTTPIAMEAQRIGAMPEKELRAELKKAAAEDYFCSFSQLLVASRSYWYQASRKKKHKDIADAVQEAQEPDNFGPFPLIYADPPWKFKIYSEKGLERTPDQHYPTLDLPQIRQFEIYGKSIDEIANKDAALLLWCTSSNMHNALGVMEAWGFEFKSSAVWVKDKSGLGLVFRNQHEVLLYGTKGNMPGPQYQPPSVFHYPRGQHSAKPPEIRKEIEKMYPDFGQGERLEIFARGKIEGWSTYGFEALSAAAE